LQDGQADIDERPREGRPADAKHLRRYSPSTRNSKECQPSDDEQGTRQHDKAKEEDGEHEGNAYDDDAEKADKESLVGYGLLPNR
jgi:hypothetical protein